MTNWLKKQTIASWAVCASTVFGLIGTIIFLVTSTTGYLKGFDINHTPTICSFIALAIIVATFVFSEKLDSKIIDLALFVANVLLIASLMVFILDRVPLIADVHFIPVNYPPAEATALNISIVGFVFYALAIIALIISSFYKRLVKE